MKRWAIFFHPYGIKKSNAIGIGLESLQRFFAKLPGPNQPLTPEIITIKLSISMKSKHIVQHALLQSLLCAALAVQMQAQEDKQAPGGARILEQVVSVTAKVEAVDVAKRELTLKGPLGNVNTYVVSDKVKRLDEIKPGDKVAAKYYLGIAAELRAPTPEEEKAPLVVVETGAKASSEAPPGVGGVRVVRVVATIEGLDRPTQTVTLKGPRGRYLTVRVKDPSILEKPRLGDTVVVTCAEATVVSVDKVNDQE
ncbi:MAG: hypothetical protein C5B50_19045 [Verrucomicrobia bacterium]|nr:MAG: hypothetical protein C5B50_19045 [Verrucomicrobiota bacterium]